MTPLDRTPIDRAFDEAVTALSAHDPTSENYATIVDRASKLHKLKPEPPKPRVSYDTVILAAANLLGIVMIIRHEQLNVITSKAMGVLPKLR